MTDKIASKITSLAGPDYQAVRQGGEGGVSDWALGQT